MEEENPNPNSHRTPKSWSELPTDVLILVFERLSFVSFERAKSVCLSWYSSSRQCVPKKQSTPWLIFFPQDNDDENNNSCELFNPEEEKHKLYKTQDLGLEFTKSVCQATYGNWLLMRGHLSNTYIINLFTQEKINLPSLKAFQSPSFWSFWIDEKTKDYIVIYGSLRFHLVYSRSGDDTSWKQIPETKLTSHMVYNDYKLFVFGFLGDYKIFDFSRDVPELTIEAGLIMDKPRVGGPIRLPGSTFVMRTKFVVTVTGDVLKIEMMLRERESSRTWSFSVLKVYSSGRPLKKPILVESLGDEAMLFDQGITVLVNDNQVFMRSSSIYFYGKDKMELLVFDKEKRKTEPLESFDSSLVPFSRSPLWFLPSFKHVK